MNNDTTNFQNKQFNSDANNPQGEANSSNKGEGKLPRMDELKDYGKKSLTPLIDLVSKYKTEVNPYFSALSKGLQAAAEAYKEEPETIGQADAATRQAEVAIGSWFREANDWLNGINKKIQTGKTNELLDYLEEQAQRHSAMMFSVSYIAGLVFGRVGRHLGRQFKKDSAPHFDHNDSFGSQTDFGSDSLKH